MSNEIANFIVNHPYYSTGVVILAALFFMLMGGMTEADHEELKAEKKARADAEEWRDRYASTLDRSIELPKGFPPELRLKLNKAVDLTTEITSYYDRLDSEYRSQTHVKFAKMFEEQLDQVLSWVPPKERAVILQEAQDEIEYAKRLQRAGLIDQEGVDRIVECQRQRVKDIVMGDCI